MTLRAPWLQLLLSACSKKGSKKGARLSPLVSFGLSEKVGCLVIYHIDQIAIVVYMVYMAQMVNRWLNNQDDKDGQDCWVSRASSASCSVDASCSGCILCSFILCFVKNNGRL